MDINDNDLHLELCSYVSKCLLDMCKDAGGGHDAINNFEFLCNSMKILIQSQTSYSQKKEYKLIWEFQIC